MCATPEHEARRRRFSMNRRYMHSSHAVHAHGSARPVSTLAVRHGDIAAQVTQCSATSTCTCSQLHAAADCLYIHGCMHVWPSSLQLEAGAALPLRRNRHRLSTAVVLDQRMSACYNRFKFKLPCIPAERVTETEEKDAGSSHHPQKSTKDEKASRWQMFDGSVAYRGDQ